MTVVSARAWHRAGAQGLAEFAVTVPALMGVVFSIIGAGFWLYAQFVVTGAAQEGARVAAREVASAADGQQAAQRLLLGGLGARGLALSVQVTQDADNVGVEIAGQFPVSVMLGQPVAVPLHASASLIRERFRPGGD
jgi:Flp pilus assembly protein TadG